MNMTPVNDYIQSLNPTTPVTPQDMQNTARSLADELFALPESAKDSQLRQLKQYNEVLHSLVIAELQKKRSGVKQQGAMQAMAQARGQAAAQQQGGGSG